MEFLQSVGFSLASMDGPQGTSEDFYVLEGENVLERMKEVIEVLQTAEPIRPELHRDPHVFRPSHRATRMEIPPEFYSVRYVYHL